MRTPASFFAALLLLTSAGPIHAQDSPRHLDLEIEPLAYAFGGAGGHVAYRADSWKYEVEVFQLTIPASLHGNDSFDASPLGVEFHAEHFFGDDAGGFYAGPEVGLVRLDVSHAASGTSEHHTRYSVGVRGGYQWYTGLGNLYLSPVIGVSYTLNDDAISIRGDTFKSTPLGAWGTVGLGWSFGR